MTKRGRLAHKLRQLEKDWLANRDKEREIGSQTATMREGLNHKPRQRWGDWQFCCDTLKYGTFGRKNVT